MTRTTLLRIFVAGATVTLPTISFAQTPEAGVQGAPAIKDVAAPRPTISVIAFDTDRTGWMPPPHFGETVADLLASRLVELGAYRVLDRSVLPPAGSPGARVSFDAIRDVARQAGLDYVVVGAVTKFSNEKTKKRGGLLGIPFLGGLGKNTHESALGIALRVVDVRTGEILTALVAEGASSKTSRTVGAGGLVKGVPLGGLYSSSSTGSLDRLLSIALAEAVEEAATSLTKSALKSGSGSPEWRIASR